uniref:Secretoglobin family 1A member 1 isoform 2 n=1 Tax=Homo sapiens TaxID=9606 RepID=A0A0S2Z4L0_HUMAN|nr:secretoglobin family 1A member 1 isoform 2 [Homo sapiens]
MKLAVTLTLVTLALCCSSGECSETLPSLLDLGTLRTPQFCSEEGVSCPFLLWSCWEDLGMLSLRKLGLLLQRSARAFSVSSKPSSWTHPPVMRLPWNFSALIKT